MKRLIINADDFGLTQGINRAVLALNAKRVLTSSTLMASASYAEEAAQAALLQPALGIGCHLVLVDGVPVLPAAELPTLVDQRSGRFRGSLGTFVRACLLGHIDEREIQAEAEAQIARIQSFGLHPTHLDTHKHTHMFAPVLRAVTRAAQSREVRCVRNPFEPRWSIAATVGAPLLRRIQVNLLRQLEPAFLRVVRDAGLFTTDGAIGVLATGTLDAATLKALLSAMPPGTWEFVTHPGYNDIPLAKAGTRLLAARETELEMLEAAVFEQDVQLIHFGELLSSESQH